MGGDPGAVAIRVDLAARVGHGLGVARIVAAARQREGGRSAEDQRDETEASPHHRASPYCRPPDVVKHFRHGRNAPRL
jgi:hypothetical protein